MLNTTLLQDFVQAAGEATVEYTKMSFGIENGITPDRFELIENDSPLPTSGSCLVLTVNDMSITVGLLSIEDNLMKMAKSILDLPVDQEISKEEMMDTVNEMINIISGGIKSRLNNKVEGGITLGLPKFIELDWDNYHNAAAIAKILIDDMPVYLLASSIAH